MYSYLLDEYMIEVEDFLALTERDKNVSEILSELVR